MSPLHSSSDPARLHPWIIAVTGASGTVYARRLLQLLLENEPDSHFELVISEAALRVMREEEDIGASIGRLSLEDFIGSAVAPEWSARVRIHSNRNIGATIASGSYKTSGMVVVPCSMRSLAAIANGLCENLIHRAADVVLKEQRKLILVPRETPLSLIHLENMTRLARMNVQIVPAMPGFYSRPASIGELVDHFVARLADQMGYELDLGQRWGAPKTESPVASPNGEPGRRKGVA